MNSIIDSDVQFDSYQEPGVTISGWVLSRVLPNERDLEHPADN